MPFKVRCTMTAFTGDPDRFPCHFNYKIGEYFTYDGEKFEGKICNGLLKNMAPVIWETFFYGNKEDDRMLYLYSGYSARDESMKKYDGLGFRPLKSKPEGAAPDYVLNVQEKPSGRLAKKGRQFVCDDTRTGAFFICEAVDLASGGDLLTYYNRQMSIYEKIKANPGMNVKEILDKFTKWEREEIYPPIHDLNLSLMLDEMAEVGYIELKDGRAYPNASQ